MTGHQRGATLVELLVAMALFGLALGVLAMLSLPVMAAFDADPAAADAQQRVRSGAHTLIEDVQRAGSGFLLAPDAAPGVALPALLPDATAVGAWAVSPRPSTLTTWRAPRGAAHGVVRGVVAAGDIVVPLQRAAFCAASPTCGFATDDEILLMAPHGRLGVATIRAVMAPLDLLLTAPLSDAWPVGTVVSAAVSHTYERRIDAATGLFQLTRRLGAGPATPVIDYVRRFDVEWVATRGTPRVVRAPDGTEERATHGPSPPALTVVADAAWPPGENCAFFRDGAGAPHWRGAAGGVSAAPMPLAALADGPWCPSPTAPTRWDADMARVGEVRIVIGVAVAATTLRPAAGLGLARPGGRLVPDLVVETVIRPGRHGGGD